MMLRRIVTGMMMCVDAVVFIGSFLFIYDAMQASHFYTENAPQWEMSRYMFIGVAGAIVYVLLTYASCLYTGKAAVSQGRIPVYTALNCACIYAIVVYSSWRYAAYFSAGELIAHRPVLYALVCVYVLSTLLHSGYAALWNKSPSTSSVKQ